MDNEEKYHDRKGNLSQDVMGVCSFDYKFQYVLAGWEGSATDSHVLASDLSRAYPLIVPLGILNHISNDYIVIIVNHSVYVISIIILIVLLYRKVLFS